jgi:hypothetical protein
MLPGTVGLAGLGRSQIGYVGVNTGDGGSITIPTHQAGDTILIVATSYANVIPSLPAGFTNIQAGTDALENALAWRLGYKVATSASETSGTWSNADGVTAAVYRGVTGIGASAAVADRTTTPSWGALSLLNNGGSWVVGFLLNEDAAITSNLPFTSRLNTNYDCMWDTGGPVYSFSQVTADVTNFGADGVVTLTVELTN